MRTTKLFATFLVAGLIVAGCKQDEDYVLPAITISTPTLDFSADTEQNVDLLATRDWQILGKPEWVQRIEPDHGPGTSTLQRIRLFVDPNDGYNREGEVVFTIGLAKSTLTLTQLGAKGEVPVGTGTKDDPYTVKGVMDYVKAMASGAESPGAVYIKGKISQITMTFGGSGTYGNANFYISDDGSYNKETNFYCFQVYYLGGVKWKTGDKEINVGDDVIIYGKVTNYGGNTPETTGKGTAFIYELNGDNKGGDTGSGGGGGNTGTPSGTGTQADPYNAAAAAAAVASLTWTSNTDYQTTEDVYVKGKICKIADSGKYADSGTNGNATFYISDDGTENGTTFYVYRALYLGGNKYSSGTDIKVGDDVIIYGKLMNYRGNTPETVAGKAYLYSLNGETQGNGGGGTTTEVKVVTVAQFNAAPDSDTQKYQLTGKVSGNINSTYGNFDLVDDTGTVYVYGLTKTDLGYGATNDKSFESLGLKAGDTVTIIGYRKTYKKEGQDDKIEVVYAYYVSHTAGSGDSGGSQGGGETTTQVKTVTVAEFLAAADSKTQKYQLTGVVSGTVNETYGNFDLKDDSGTIYVYGLTKTELGYGATNDKSFASLGIKAGDTVTLIGYRGTYKKEGQDDKPEVMYAYYVSHTPAN